MTVTTRLRVLLTKIFTKLYQLTCLTQDPPFVQLLLSHENFHGNFHKDLYKNFHKVFHKVFHKDLYKNFHKDFHKVFHKNIYKNFHEDENICKILILIL